MAANDCGLNCDLSQVDEVHALSPEQMSVMELRVGFVVRKLCETHFKEHFLLYQMKQTKCSDPKNVHKKAVKGDLRDITLKFAQQVQNCTEFRVIPGKRICKRCETSLRDIVEETESVHEEISPVGSPSGDSGEVDTQPM